jgi:hypothetical protein
LQGTRLVASDSKSLRGFHHIDLADLLCLLKLTAEFECDPMYASLDSFFYVVDTFSRDFMKQVEDGTIEITADDLPSFLNETGTVYN